MITWKIILMECIKSPMAVASEGARGAVAPAPLNKTNWSRDSFQPFHFLK